MFNNISVMQFLKTVKNCSKCIFNYNPIYLLVTFLVTLIDGIIPIGMMVLLQKILNNLQLGKSSHDSLSFFIIAYVGLEIANSVLSEIYSFYVSKNKMIFSKNINISILNQTSKLSLSEFENSDTYDDIKRAQNIKGEDLIQFYHSILDMIKQIVSLIASVWILFTYKNMLFIIILLIPGIQYLYSLKVGKEQYEMRYARTKKEREAWYIDYLITSGIAIKEMSFFNLSNFFITKYKKIRDNLIFQDLHIIKKATLVNTLLVFLDQILAGIIFAYIVIQGSQGKLLIGDVSVFTGCVYSIKNNASGVLLTLSDIIRTTFYIDALFAFMDKETKATIDEHSKKPKIKIYSIDNIELKNVSYKYRNCKEFALKNISLKIVKGFPVCLLGENGSGKSTLIKIILGLYDDYEGVILVNGICLKEIDKRAYMDRVSCIFQDFIKYETSIRENIVYGDISSIGDNKRILKLVQGVNLINKFKDKVSLDNVLGSWFGEVQLSAGEWQRIAVMRMLIKDADMYLLDEPDSALDVESEMQLINLYNEKFKNKIAIIVTHKISHVSLMADEIAVLHEGEMVEQGTHKQLFLLGGKYKKMYEKHSLKRVVVEATV